MLGNIHWDSNPMDPRLPMPSDSYIKLKNVIKVLGGKMTPNFQRDVAKKAPDHLVRQRAAVSGCHCRVTEDGRSASLS